MSRFSLHAYTTKNTFRKQNMNDQYPFFNTPLPYTYDALEPFIDEKTMRLHHDRHLQTYIDNLNQLLEANPSLQQYSLAEMLVCPDRLPCRLRTPLLNNGGGVFNHRFFFEGMTKAGSRGQAPALSRQIVRQFGSTEYFKSCFKEAALSVFGSGYAWLVWANRALYITTSANQDTPDLCRTVPLLAIDVWEHAYYLKHYNMRAAYIDDWFRVVNWHCAEARFQRYISNHMAVR